jgi:monoamine oxidase
MKEDIKIISLHHYYWNNGTHYYKPHNIDNFHNKVLNPMDNLYVVGEMVAGKQGWINGALSTSIDVANKIIAKSL